MWFLDCLGQLIRCGHLRGSVMMGLRLLKMTICKQLCRLTQCNNLIFLIGSEWCFSWVSIYTGRLQGLLHQWALWTQAGTTADLPLVMTRFKAVRFAHLPVNGCVYMCWALNKDFCTEAYRPWSSALNLRSFTMRTRKAWAQRKVLTAKLESTFELLLCAKHRADVSGYFISIHDTVGITGMF